MLRYDDLLIAFEINSSKALLVRRRALDRWHEFEAKATETALREWCAENGIELAD